MVVPIRCFSGALSRLGDALDGPGRAALMRLMAARVLRAASPYPVHVATHDGEVAEWAGGIGVPVIPTERPGLSAAAERSLDWLVSNSVDRAVIIHADLVLARTLAPVVGDGLVIAPDRRRDGSNAVCVPAGSGFRFSYGPGSFQRHVAEAGRLGLPVTVVDEPALAFDVDDVGDLRSLPSPMLVELGLDPDGLL